LQAAIARFHGQVVVAGTEQEALADKPVDRDSRRILCIQGSHAGTDTAGTDREEQEQMS
jgi:hypothetical protein